MNSSFLAFGPNDNQVDLAALFSENNKTVGVIAALGFGFLFYLLTLDKSHIKKIRGWPIIGQLAFFTKRHDFLYDNLHGMGDEPMFGFNILKHNVVALKGEEARKLFFNRRDLSFSEGYRLLLGGAPDLKDVSKDFQHIQEAERLVWFSKRLIPLLRNERLLQLTPQFMTDLERNMVKWGDQGQFDPFEDIYTMVFHLTIRAAGCREIADSPEDCKKLEKLYWQIEKGATPASVLFPWFPSKARKLRVAATNDIFHWFDAVAKARKAEGRREEDAFQDMLDTGDSSADIIRFIMGVLFAGVVNSGLMSAWIFIFLDQEPEWRDKVLHELHLLLEKYAPASEGVSSPSERFSVIPPQVWENEMPILEACLRETIRLIFSGALLRRVTTGDIELTGKTIPNGTFLTYLTSQTHIDPEIYPNPTKFDPGRYSDGQDKAQAYAFLGWGVGRHPCLGRRFAQYEIKAICAMVLASYEYSIVDSKGRKPDPSATVPDRNNIYQARPKNETFYMRYKKREVPL
ncbi:cytochrome P450 [Ceratobasidium sp. AG-I]|nr:cytochrome P450 [Ceratobasidium sp. AG-I]